VSRIIIVGGGFAGIAAACHLAREGHHPLVLERAPRLGGRAASFFHSAANEIVDYGQHVLMRCCSSSLELLDQLEMRHAVEVQRALHVPFASPTGRAVLHSSTRLGRYHLAPSLLRFALLPLRDRLSVLPAAAALASRAAIPDGPFSAWLATHRQSSQAVSALWDPICRAALNATPEQVGAEAVHQVVREALAVPLAAGMALFTVPLSSIFDAARRHVEDRAGSVRLNAAVRRLWLDGARVRGVRLTSGEAIAADAVICTVSPQDLRPVAQGIPALEGTLGAASHLTWAPIVNLHAWFDRPVMDTAFAMAFHCPIQSVFDITALHRGAPAGDLAHLVVSQSAAAEWMSQPPADVARTLLRGLAELFPRVRGAACVRQLVLRQPRATFVPSPGSQNLRPQTTTPVQGLYLAGDWVATGWPSTIEGAIRSGCAAAEHALRGCCG